MKNEVLGWHVTELRDNIIMKLVWGLRRRLRDVTYPHAGSWWVRPAVSIHVQPYMFNHIYYSTMLNVYQGSTFFAICLYIKSYEWKLQKYSILLKAYFLKILRYLFTILKQTTLMNRIIYVLVKKISHQKSKTYRTYN